MKDFKNKFYRSLNLDKDTRDLLRWYKKVSKEMQNEPDCKKSDLEEETQ